MGDNRMAEDRNRWRGIAAALYEATKSLPDEQFNSAEIAAARQLYFEAIADD